jgi:membrane protein implicated in regulation of membrane protease activity
LSQLISAQQPTKTAVPLLYCAPVALMGHGGFLFVQWHHDAQREVCMADWIVWFGLAGALVILEMFSGTFYLLMIGLGMAAGGLVSLGTESRPAQLLTAAVIGIIATYALRRSRWLRPARHDAAKDPNINLDIGQTVHVEAWTGNEGEPRTARILYRGAYWDAELQDGVAPHPGTFVIREIRGSRLILALGPR